MDSEDDRKIKKCEKRAKELVDQRFKKKQKTGKNNFRQNNNNYDRRTYNSSSGYESNYRQIGSNRSNSNWNQGGYIPSSNRRPGARNECYNCGSVNHFVNECPDRRDRASGREQKCELAVVGVSTVFVSDNDFYSNLSSDFTPPVFVHTVSDFESIEGVDISVVGLLAKNVNFMHKIEASPYICDDISNGYVIPLSSQPNEEYFNNNASSHKFPDFVRQSIDKPVYQGTIEELFHVPKIVNPLTVAQRNGKFRLVLDLRYVNLYVKKRRLLLKILILH